MPLSHLEPAPGRRAAAPAPRRRGVAGAARRAGRAACRAASGRRISVAAGVLARLPGRRHRRASRSRAAPATPNSAISALASLSLHLARSTNIDRRFSVAREHARPGRRAGTRRRRGARSTKLACRRPLAEQKPASRARPGVEAGDVAGELALQEARGVGAAGADHAPVGEAAAPPIGDLVEVMRRLSSAAHDVRDARGLTLAASGRRRSMRVWPLPVPASLLAAAVAVVCRPPGLVADIGRSTLAADPVELSIEPGTHAARDRRGLGATPACRRRRCCSTSGSAGRARRARSAPAATRSAPARRRSRLLDKMVRGDETLAAVRLIEGWTFRQIRAELARAPRR